MNMMKTKPGRHKISPWKTNLFVINEPSGILLEPGGFFLWIPAKKRKVFVQNARENH